MRAGRRHHRDCTASGGTVRPLAAQFAESHRRSGLKFRPCATVPGESEYIQSLKCSASAHPAHPARPTSLPGSEPARRRGAGPGLSSN
eukprot:276697-Hanusia_phi.AAC.1